MAEANATIVENSSIADRMSRVLAKSEAENVLGSPQFEDFSNDPNFSRAPDYFLFVYNISDREFVVRRPPTMPCITIPACPPDKPYVLALRVPSIHNEKYVEAFTGKISVSGTRGERIATDLLNPSNYGTDCWATTEDWSNQGNDLTVRGCFWSRNNPPTAAELAKARQRLEAHYRALIEQANGHHAANRFAEIGPEHHSAAEYFRLTLPWHRRYEAPATCPVCGEEISAGAAAHRNSFGSICVLDWRRAVEGGIKTLADVPADKRWAGPKWPKDAAQ